MYLIITGYAQSIIFQSCVFIISISYPGVLGSMLGTTYR